MMPTPGMEPAATYQTAAAHTTAQTAAVQTTAQTAQVQAQAQQLGQAAAVAATTTAFQQQCSIGSPDIQASTSHITLIINSPMLTLSLQLPLGSLGVAPLILQTAAPAAAPADTPAPPPAAPASPPPPAPVHPRSHRSPSVALPVAAENGNYDGIYCQVCMRYFRGTLQTWQCGHFICTDCYNNYSNDYHSDCCAICRTVNIENPRATTLSYNGAHRIICAGAGCRAVLSRVSHIYQVRPCGHLVCRDCSRIVAQNGNCPVGPDCIQCVVEDAEAAAILIGVYRVYPSFLLN